MYTRTIYVQKTVQIFWNQELAVDTEQLIL